MHMSYGLARDRMRTGDVIAFADDSFVSGVIRWGSKANVSHVGIVYQTRDVTELLETRRTGWLSGRVGITQLSKRLEEYRENNGRVWWCPVARPPDYNEPAMIYSMLSQVGVPYDWWQAIGTVLWRRWLNPGSERLFCSESVGVALQAGRILPTSLNTSRATPGNVVSWHIYSSQPYQILGDPAYSIGLYNSVDPHLWRALPCVH